MKSSALLVGNPNCGKTTLFNALTGQHQKVGNWPGVTVEQKTGRFTTPQSQIELTDLPGVYALHAQSQSIDEKIALEALATGEHDLVINVIDASHLERNLYLTIQLREMGVPMVVVLNMVDVAKRRSICIDAQALSKALDVPVVPLIGHKREGIETLRNQIDKLADHPKPLEIKYDKHVEAVIKASGQAGRWDALCHIESLQDEHDYDLDIAQGRYDLISQILSGCQRIVENAKTRWTERLDSVFLHRFFGVPIFLFMMYLLFECSITLGGAFQPLFSVGSEVIFIQGVAYLAQQLHSPDWLITVLSEGLGLGINTVLTFIPQIAFLWCFLILLERTGYMARAAFVVDRLMQSLGLPGQAFVPLIVGFGCNIPAVMASRTLDHQRDRIIAIMMTPFMSCGARLAIFAVFAAAFFPSGGAQVVFALYLIGILAALFTGFVLKHTLLKGHTAPLMMALPPYNMPLLSEVYAEVIRRVRGFVLRAGKMIIPVCVVLGSTHQLTWDGTASWLSSFGQWLTPLFTPMGITMDNWPATVGLLTGVVAKEVVIGTLNTLYTQQSEVFAAASFDLWGGLWGAVMETWDSLRGIGVEHFIQPFSANMADAHMSHPAIGNMVQAFGSTSSAFVYMLFVLLYVPCVSTIGAAAKEAGLKWSILSAVWSVMLAYTVSVTVYQCLHIQEHMLSSLVWIGGCSLTLVSTIKAMALYHARGER